MKSSDSLDEARIREVLELALNIIVDEYPACDERYQWAMKIAKQFEIDMGEYDEPDTRR